MNPTEDEKKVSFGASIFTITLIIFININYIAGYEKIDGTISNITTTSYTCSQCIKMNNNDNCILYKDTTCFDNTMYATNNHATCSLTKIISELNNQDQFILDTPIGNKVKWYKHLNNNECIEDISGTVTIITVIAGLFMFASLMMIYEGLSKEYEANKRNK